MKEDDFVEFPDYIFEEECFEAAAFELLITEIKEIGNNQALITGDDGAGLNFVFIEKNYSKNNGKYRIGKKGVYRIAAELESVEVPEDCEEGVVLEGEDAKKFFDWVEDEVEDDASACVGFQDLAVYHPCDDFAQTGRYNFYGIATNPICLSVSEEIDALDPEKNSGFIIPLMNQFNKKEPRFIEAAFEQPNYYKGIIEEGWAVKAVLRLTVSHDIANNVYEYGANETVSPEEKGLFGHDEDEYFEDEEGNRWLKDSDENFEEQ